MSEFSALDRAIVDAMENVTDHDNRTERLREFVTYLLTGRLRYLLSPEIVPWLDAFFWEPLLGRHNSRPQGRTVNPE